MKTKKYYVYIMMSISGVVYVGVTNNLQRRKNEHVSLQCKGFSQKYKCTKLVYFEETDNIAEALTREKQIKKWSRIKKEKLVKILNPYLNDIDI